MELVEREEFKENEGLHTAFVEEEGLNFFELALRGRQKINHSMAASISEQIMGIRNNTIRDSLASPVGVSHHIEYVATIRGTMYINDSKATNLNSTWFSLESMDAPVVLILGGDTEAVDYSIIKELVNEKVKAIVCIGSNNKHIHDTLSLDTRLLLDVNTLEEAVNTAYMLAKKGDVVLFSPACPSFGRFQNYEDRGNQYTQAVRNL